MNKGFLWKKENSVVKVQLFIGDITRIEGAAAVDVICNAANEEGLGGGGVDGAIHRACGREFTLRCNALSFVPSSMHPNTLVRCPTGSARPVHVSDLGLPFKYVLQSVGPTGSHPDREALLKKTYASIMDECHLLKARSVAIPAISTAAYGYPFDEATRVALDSIFNTLQVRVASSQLPLIERIVFILHDCDPFLDSHISCYLKELSKYCQ